jgi:hypothetical protein
VTAATVKRMFRGKTYQIELSNRDGKQSYVQHPLTSADPAAFWKGATHEEQQF